jgi:hypothetical protein
VDETEADGPLLRGLLPKCQRSSVVLVWETSVLLCVRPRYSANAVRFLWRGRKGQDKCRIVVKWVKNGWEEGVLKRSPSVKALFSSTFWKAGFYVVLFQLEAVKWEDGALWRQRVVWQMWRMDIGRCAKRKDAAEPISIMDSFESIT